MAGASYRCKRWMVSIVECGKHGRPRRLVYLVQNKAEGDASGGPSVSIHVRIAIGTSSVTLRFSVCHIHVAVFLR